MSEEAAEADENEKATEADENEKAAKSDENEETAYAYYEAIDAGDYDRFADLLASDVVHERPDRTIEGRETLVGFMREGRPNEDTSHEILRTFGADDEADVAVAVEGHLLGSDGTKMFSFVDSFAFEDGEIAEIRTYTR